MKALRDVFGDTLVSLGWTNPNVVVLDADLANSTKADKFAMAYPERFLQMGIAEQNFVGVAVGLASLGFVPWLSTFTVFFTHRGLDPIRMLVAQTHANVKIGAAYSGILTGLTGKTHQDVEDIAIMRAMPDMTVLAPADAIEGDPQPALAAAGVLPQRRLLRRESRQRRALAWPAGGSAAAFSRASAGPGPSRPFCAVLRRAWRATS